MSVAAASIGAGIGATIAGLIHAVRIVQKILALTSNVTSTSKEHKDIENLPSECELFTGINTGSTSSSRPRFETETNLSSLLPLLPRKNDGGIDFTKDNDIKEILEGVYNFIGRPQEPRKCRGNQDPSSLTN